MRATADYVRQKFDEFNRLIFDGELPLLPIRIGRAKRSLGSMCCQKRRSLTGQTVNSNFKMTISSLRDLPERELEDVIIHEMIHYYIMYKGIKDGSAHGRVFRQIMNSINTRFGRHITISRRRDDGDAAPARQLRPHYFCVCELHDGRLGICVTAKSRIFAMWKAIPVSFRVKSARWFWSTDPRLDRYPKSLKPKLYLADRTGMEGILKAATELENTGTVIRAKTR